MNPLRDSVHIWRVPYDPAQASDPAWQAMLNDDELIRAKAFRFDRDRLAFTHAHGTLRKLLGRYLQTPPAEIQFRLEEHGKPIVTNMSGDSRLCFNLSHTKGVALVAVTDGIEVGVDVEAVRPVQERQSIANSHFSDQERRLFRPGDDDSAFFGCWTRKEAALKAIGTGLMRPLHTFGIVPDRIRSDWHRIVGDFPDADQWRVYSFQMEPDYFGAVAVAAGHMKPTFLQWDQGEAGP